METISIKRSLDTEMHVEPRKRFKATDLPLSSTQRSAIDGLLHTFKKSGEFDAIRKNVYSQFDASEAKNTLTTALTGLAEAELDRNPSLLSKDRRQAAPLVEGAVERSDIYRGAEENVDAFVENYIQAAEVKLREFRRKDIGDDAAGHEEQLGSKTDEDYMNESSRRRRSLEKRREDEAELERRRLLEEKRRKEDEQRRQKEKEAAEEAERDAAEEKKRAELEAEREKARLEKEEKERQRMEYLELKRRQDAEWAAERAKKEEEQRKRREKEREKEIEAVALEELIRECEQAAAKPKLFERSESPGRKSTPKATTVTAASATVSKESNLASIMKAELLQNEKARSGYRDGQRRTSHAASSAAYGKPPNLRGGESTRGSRSPTSHADHTGRYYDGHRSSRYAATSSRPAYDSRSRHHDTYYDSRTSRYTEDRRSSSRVYDERDRDRRKDDRDDRDDRSRRRHSRSPSAERSSHHHHHHRTYRDRSRTPTRYRRGKSRSRSPRDIDRYVPGSSRAKAGYEQRESGGGGGGGSGSGSGRREGEYLKHEEEHAEKREEGHSARREQDRQQQHHERERDRDHGSRDDRKVAASSDRYLPGRGRGERDEDEAGRGSRRMSKSRSRSRSRSRKREKDHERRSRSSG